MNRNSKYNRVLLSAASIVKKQGVERLTLEAVAKKAGISKGGLLYHFPNKELLLEGMVKYMAGDFVHSLQERINSSSHDRGKWSRAYIQQTVEDINKDNGISEALIVAMFANPELLLEMQTHYAQWQQNFVQDGIDPVQATMVRLIADGLWFSEVFGLGKIDEALRNQILEKAIQLTK